MVHVHVLDAVSTVQNPRNHNRLTRLLCSIGALRKNVSFIALFAFLAATFAVLAAAQFTAKVRVPLVNGYFFAF